MGNIIQVDNSAHFICISNSSGGVSLEENITLEPENPQALDIISSVKEEQSVPQPYSCKIFKINGLGVAFTAKYSLYPLFQENACFNRLTFSRMPFHHTDKTELDRSSQSLPPAPV